MAFSTRDLMRRLQLRLEEQDYCGESVDEDDLVFIS